MLKNAKILTKRYISFLDGLEKTRNRMEGLYSSGNIFSRDIEQVYCGLFLNAVARFESFIEDVFIGMLVRKYRVPSTNLRITFKSKDVVRDMIFFKKKYIDWLPYVNTIERAELYFKNALPFSKIDTQEQALLEHICIIRNSIAHVSDHSQKKFRTQVIGNANLLPLEKKPAGYLRGMFRALPSLTRYQNYILTLAQLSEKITN